MREAIEALHTRYIRVIDDGELEAWPALFTPDGLYRIVTRENLDAGLPLAVMECQGRGMMEDRVTGFRRINVFEPQRYLHQVSELEIEQTGERTAVCRSNYLVIRTLGDGAMSIFSAGQYHDEVALDGGRALFHKRVVIPDSRRIDTLLVIPL